MTAVCRCPLTQRRATLDQPVIGMMRRMRPLQVEAGVAVGVAGGVSVGRVAVDEGWRGRYESAGVTVAAPGVRVGVGVRVGERVGLGVTVVAPGEGVGVMVRVGERVGLGGMVTVMGEGVGVAVTVGVGVGVAPVGSNSTSAMVPAGRLRRKVVLRPCGVIK